MNRAKELLHKLSIAPGVSGYENSIIPIIEENVRELVTETKIDKFGNLFCFKKGQKGKYKIMLAAHMDEIGLIVKEIDSRGFIRFTSIGGVDQRTLLSQEVIIHGKKDLLGVIGTMPPHLLQEDSSEKAVKMDDMGIDVGLSYEEIKKYIEVGDIISAKRIPLNLLNDIMAGKSFDDRAGIVVMAICLEELVKLQHSHDVYAVATVQEEVGVRGATTSAYSLNPDLAIAIDVTHAATPDTRGQVYLELGKGPSIALGPNIHPSIYKALVETSILERLPHQIEPIPGISGTDAWAIQVTQAGIPTGLVSIPLRYMHTSVEALDMQDVVNAGKLLAYFIANLPENLEELLCY